jgi:hypothetical protein
MHRSLSLVLFIILVFVSPKPTAKTLDSKSTSTKLKNPPKPNASTNLMTSQATVKNSSILNLTKGRVYTPLALCSSTYIFRNQGHLRAGKEAAIVGVIDSRTFPRNSDEYLRTNELFEIYGTLGTLANITGNNASTKGTKAFPTLRKGTIWTSLRTETSHGDVPSTLHPFKYYHDLDNALADFDTMTDFSGQDRCDRKSWSGLMLMRIQQSDACKGSLISKQAMATNRQLIDKVRHDDEAHARSVLRRVQGTEPVAKMMETLMISREELKRMFTELDPDALAAHMCIVQQFPAQSTFAPCIRPAQDGTVFTGLTMTKEIMASDLSSVDEQDLDGHDKEGADAESGPELVQDGQEEHHQAAAAGAMGNSEPTTIQEIADSADAAMTELLAIKKRTADTTLTGSWSNSRDAVNQAAVSSSDALVKLGGMVVSVVAHIIASGQESAALAGTSTLIQPDIKTFDKSDMGRLDKIERNFKALNESLVAVDMKVNAVESTSCANKTSYCRSPL